LQITTDGVKVPEGATSACFKVVILEFDIDTKASTLCESENYFFNTTTLSEKVTLYLPTMEFFSGVLFIILVIAFYRQEDGVYVPLEDDRSKVVIILK